MFINVHTINNALVDSTLVSKIPHHFRIQMLQLGLMMKTTDHIIILFNEPEKSLNSKHETVTFT